MDVKLNALALSGMLLDEAKMVLEQEGVSEFEVIVTGPPRLSDRTIHDDFRVMLVHWERHPIQVLVCGKQTGNSFPTSSISS